MGCASRARSASVTSCVLRRLLTPFTLKRLITPPGRCMRMNVCECLRPRGDSDGLPALGVPPPPMPMLAPLVGAGVVGRVAGDELQVMVDAQALGGQLGVEVSHADEIRRSKNGGCELQRPAAVV